MPMDCSVKVALASFTRALAYDGSSVAVKAFRVKSRSQEHQELQERYQKEVAIFKLLGLGPGGPGGPGQHDENPRRLFVNLLDYSRNQAGTPGPEKDGKFYMILELGHESLDMWLRTTGFIRMANFIEIARSLLAALEFLHGLGFVHLDVKPDNIMRFGSLWKLIDLGSCLYVGDVVPLDGFTPLYCSPELAEAALEESEANPGPLRWPLRARPAMDLWAAGAGARFAEAHLSNLSFLLPQSLPRTCPDLKRRSCSSTFWFRAVALQRQRPSCHRIVPECH